MGPQPLRAADEELHEVELGRVVLSGEVASDDDAQRALRIARAVNGVRSLIDEMARRRDLPPARAPFAA